MHFEWKPGLLGVGQETYEVYLKRAYVPGPFKKVYQGRDTSCEIWLPYTNKPIRYVWYVRAKLGRRTRDSKRRSFLLKPIQLPPPQDFLTVDLETPENTLRALAKTSQLFLQTEERVEVILDRPLIPFVFFQKGSDQLEEVSRWEFMASLVAHLKANPDVVLHIKGYVDAESDTVTGEEVQRLSLARAQRVQQLILRAGGQGLAAQVKVDTLDPQQALMPRIIEMTRKPEEMVRIQAENRRAALEAWLKRPFERDFINPSDLTRSQDVLEYINRVLDRNPDVTLMVGAGNTKQILAVLQELRQRVHYPERIYAYFIKGHKVSGGFHVYLSAEKLIYKPVMPKIIRSKLGRSFLSLDIDTLRAPSPFWWRMYLAPVKEVLQQKVSANWILVDSGYVSQEYQSWRYHLSWHSPAPLNLKWNPDNPYALVLDTQLELTGTTNRFVRPLKFQPRREHIQTYRMILVQHVFASEASESRFLEARVRDILERILALKPREHLYHRPRVCYQR